MKNSELVMNWLKEQGFCPNYDEDGDIIFKYQRLTIIYFVNDDKDRFHMSLPCIYDVTDDNRISVLEAVNEFSKRINMIKACASKTDVHLSAEALFSSTLDLDDFIPEVLEGLSYTGRIFKELMDE